MNYKDTFSLVQNVSKLLVHQSNYVEKKVCVPAELHLLSVCAKFMKLLSSSSRFFSENASIMLFCHPSDCRIQRKEKFLFYCFTKKWNSGILIFNAMQVSAYEFRIYFSYFPRIPSRVRVIYIDINIFKAKFLTLELRIGQKKKVIILKQFSQMWKVSFFR